MASPITTEGSVTKGWIKTLKRRPISTKRSSWGTGLDQDVEAKADFDKAKQLGYTGTQLPWSVKGRHRVVRVAGEGDAEPALQAWHYLIGASLPALNLSPSIFSFLSGVTQNQPVKVEIKGFKTSTFLEQKTAPQFCPDAGPMGHVERPQSEPSGNDLHLRRPRLVPATYRPRTRDRSRDSRPVFAVSKTSHFDHRL
jgi:hypothetical protein